MTFPDSSSLLDRLAAARQERERELAATRRAPVTAEQRLGLPFTPGDRVFDTLSGSHGRVARVDPAPAGGSIAVLVQLDDGMIVTREPSTLIDRPSER
jgi:hypothetical protein